MLKERINRNREIISLQIKCYKKIFSLYDQMYDPYPQYYYIDIIAVDSTESNLDMSLTDLCLFFFLIFLDFCDFF